MEEAKKETRQLNCYVTDYLNINEDLLTLVQRKEEEVILKLKSFILKDYFFITINGRIHHVLSPFIHVADELFS